MKTMVLIGTARRDGETAVLLRAIMPRLKEMGEVKEFLPFYDHISACTDCRWCWHNPGCSIDDAMQGIYRCVEDCDNVVIASPIYFGMLTPPMLAIQSRFQAYYSESFGALPQQGPRKKGAILLTGGGFGGHEAAEKTARSMLHVMNAEWVGTALSASTDTLPAAQDDAVLLAVDKIVENLGPAS